MGWDVHQGRLSTGVGSRWSPLSTGRRSPWPAERPSLQGRRMALSALTSGLLSLGVAAIPVTASATPPAEAWRWPLPGTPVVARPFQRPPHPWAAGHRGVDLAAAPGTVVLAAGAGVVSFAGYVAGVGVVAVVHPGGLRTTYEPVAPEISAGAVVCARATDRPPAARATATAGRPAGACTGGCCGASDYLDPLTLVRRGPVRLLPLVGAPPAHRWRRAGAAQRSGGCSPTVRRPSGGRGLSRSGPPGGSRPALHGRCNGHRRAGRMAGAAEDELGVGSVQSRWSASFALSWRTALVCI